MIERLKVCWYVLIKKHYAFYAFDRMEEGNSGARCYIESGVEESYFFLTLIIEYTKTIINKCKWEVVNKNEKV